MNGNLSYNDLLQTAIEEALEGLDEGGIPIGAAMFDKNGCMLSRGHNRRIQENDPSIHAETDAFRKAGRLGTYQDKIMVTTLAQCWYCSGLVRQFKIGTVVVGESRNFSGGIEWLREIGVAVIDLDSSECYEMLSKYTQSNPKIWNEDIGEA
jgi:cytosine deaminase